MNLQHLLAWLRQGSRGLTLFALMILFGLFTQSCFAANKKTAAEEDIREAVIRTQIHEWDKIIESPEVKTGKANQEIFFISINHKDPTDEFVRRFKDIPRIVKKLSSSKIVGRSLAVVDRATGQPGRILSADRIHWLSNESVTVEGGYHCGGVCGGQITFTLQKQNNKWVVISSQTGFEA